MCVRHEINGVEKHDKLEGSINLFSRTAEQQQRQCSQSKPQQSWCRSSRACPHSMQAAGGGGNACIHRYARYALTGLESGKFFPREPFVLPLDTRLFQRPAYRLGSAREVEVREDELGTHAAGRSEVIRCAWCRKVFFCSVPTVCAVSWVGVGVQNSRNGRKAC